MLTIVLAVVGVPLGLLYANAVEWVVHKHLLHGIGKAKSSFFSFHWHDHHQEARKQHMFDSQYTRPLFTWSPQGKEALSVFLLALAHAPLLPYLPTFALTIFYSGLRYYRIHKRAHQDHEWGKQHVPWHYDHHMGKDQNANWCVTSEWFDVLMGSRKVYGYDERGKPLGELPVPARRGLIARFISPIWESSGQRVW